MGKTGLTLVDKYMYIIVLKLFMNYENECMLIKLLMPYIDTYVIYL